MQLLYSDYRVNNRYHLKVLCIIKKLETKRFISKLNNQTAEMVLLFAVISTAGKKSRKFVVDSSVTTSIQHNFADDTGSLKDNPKQMSEMHTLLTVQ